MSLISILIPIYTGIEFLNESLESVISQSYINWEVIIGINGYSLDAPEIIRIRDIVNSITSKYDDNIKNKIRVIYYDTKGKPATMNKMKEDSNGDYIAVLDVDDIWFPDKLEKQIPYLYNYDVIGTNCKYFGHQSNSPDIPYGDLSNYNFLIHGNPIINSSSLIRKELATWTEDEKNFDDYDLWLQLSNKNKKFFNINEILVLHRIHYSSSFNSLADQEYIKNQLSIFKKKWSLKYR